MIDAPVVTPVIGSKRVEPGKYKGSAAKVFFSPIIDAEHLIKLYNLVNSEIYGRVAIKLHTGEKHGPNILPRDLVKALQETIPDSNIVETNTLYEGDRYTTEGHRETIKVNGWTFCPVDIMDEEGSVNLPVNGGFHLKEVAMGKNILNYDSMLVLTHFKGHAMGGFGGAVKNISIGIASSAGKAWIHSAGKTKNAAEMWSALPPQDDFLESMAEAAKAVADHCGERILYINVMNNLSVDCDCDAHPAAPEMGDIGILASTDPVALDKACVDLVYASDDPGKVHLIERIESRHGTHTLDHAAAIGLGNPDYELIDIDN